MTIRTKLSALAILAALAAPLPVLAQSVDDGIALREAGSADVQAELGDLYSQGRGVAIDPDEALRWYRLAADQDHVYAQYRLGSLYSGERGPFVTDYQEAAYWFARAAKQGHETAQQELVRLRAQGLITVPDDLILAADELASFWPDGVDRPDLASLTNVYRNVPRGQELTVRFLAARIADIAAQDSMAQGWSTVRSLIDDGFIAISASEGEQNQRAGRQMLYDGLEQANALLPEGGAVPRFLYNWVDPDSSTPPPERLTQR